MATYTQGDPPLADPAPLSSRFKSLIFLPTVKPQPARTTVASRWNGTTWVRQ